jgi:hypothetical protein
MKLAIMCLLTAVFAGMLAYGTVALVPVAPPDKPQNPLWFNVPLALVGFSGCVYCIHWYRNRK